MAEALKKVEEQLKCPICLDTYADPKFLQCFHIFCQQCLQDMLPQLSRYGHDGLICPSCRMATPVPEGGVAGLQPAFYINKLLEIRESLLKKGREATQEECTPLDVNPVKKARHCFAHEGKELELYCETCGKLICCKCAIKGGKHHDHDYKQLDQAFEIYKQEITSSLEPMEKQVTIAKKVLSQLDACHKEVSFHKDTINYNIYMTFGRLRKALDEREAELSGQLDKVTQVKLKGLAAQKDQIETTLAQLCSCLHFMRESLRPGNEEDVLMMKSNTIDQVKELTIPFQLHTLKPCAKVDMEFTAPPDLSELCRNHGEVLSPGFPDPLKCHMITDESPQCALVGGKSVALLQAINCSSKPCEEPIIFECELVSEITGTRKNCNVERIGLDQYEVSYQPTVKGRHQLHIKAEGQHIRGSPFSVAVKAPVEILGSPILTVRIADKPSAVAINRNDGAEVVVTQEGGHCVSVISCNGVKVRSFGSHGSDKGQFNPPRGVAVDDEGNILVADSWNHRIQKFTAEGKFLASVGTGGSGPLQFNNPTDIAFNMKNSKVYVVDQANHRIQVLHSDLTFDHTFGKKGTGEGEFNRPWGVACDSTGKVYVADRYNNRIQVFSAEGNFQIIFRRRGQESGGLRGPYGITVDTNDVVYVSETDNNCVSVFTSEGQFVTSFGKRGEGPGEFRWPHGIAVDNTGVVYVCDYGNNRVQMF